MRRRTRRPFARRSRRTWPTGAPRSRSWGSRRNSSFFPLSPKGRGWLGRRPSRERGMSLTQAKKLRSNMTDAERRLWYRLRAHRFDGHKFKRQIPVGPYVVDFACLGRKVVIEVDGGQHADSRSDIARDTYLRDQGFQVLRFWNN